MFRLSCCRLSGASTSAKPQWERIPQVDRFRAMRFVGREELAIGYRSGPKRDDAHGSAKAVLYLRMRHPFRTDSPTYHWNNGKPTSTAPAGSNTRPRPKVPGATKTWADLTWSSLWGCLGLFDSLVSGWQRENEMLIPGKQQPSFDELVDELVRQATRAAKDRLGVGDAESPQGTPEPGRELVDKLVDEALQAAKMRLSESEVRWDTSQHARRQHCQRDRS